MTSAVKVARERRPNFDGEALNWQDSYMSKAKKRAALFSSFLLRSNSAKVVVGGATVHRFARRP
jgi:hypothetical protein